MKSVKNLYKISAGVVIIALMAMCKKPYDPAVSDAETNVLVVEGTIIPGNDSTIIRLSRTMRLNDLNLNYSTARAEKGATVNVEDDQGKTYPLAEAANGNYVSPNLNLPGGRKYRVNIKTTGGEAYLSSLEAQKNSPQIDSIGFTVGDGVQVYANTHDATNSTLYYRWDFTETWKFQTLYSSRFQSDGTDIIPRSISVDYCFANARSNVIVLGTSTKLIKDEINRQPIMKIPTTDERIGIRYSILVKQYALTKAAYEFWSNIKRNTETLGSVFDAQPSAPIGNIQCISTPGKPVVGYISVGTVQSKRIFIDKSQLPSGWRVTYPFQCSKDSVFFERPAGVFGVKESLVPPTAGRVPLEEMYVRGGLAGYIASSRSCADCTVRGVLAPPSFWK